MKAKLSILLVTLLIFTVSIAPTLAQDVIDVDGEVEASLSEESVSYTIDLEAGQGILISVMSDEFDTFVEVQDESGSSLASDDDGGDFFNSLLRFTPDAGGTYSIVVSAAFGLGTGPFTLSVESLVVTPMTYGEPVDADFEVNATSFYTFDGSAGDVVNITATPSSDGINLEVTLLDPLNIELANSSFSADDIAAIRRFVLPVDGTYTFTVADSFSNESTGAYTALVETTESLVLELDTPVTVELSEETLSSETLTFEAEVDTNYQLTMHIVEGGEFSTNVDVEISQPDSLTTVFANGSNVSTLVAIFTLENEGTTTVVISTFNEGIYDLTLTTLE